MPKSRPLRPGMRIDVEVWAVASLDISRRKLLRVAAASAASTLVNAPAVAQASPRVVIVGGGFGGATLARTLKKADPRISVTLVESSRTFTACPFSNAVIAGLRDLDAQQFGYEKIAGDGVSVAFDTATAIDVDTRTVTLGGGGALAYD